MVQVQAYLLSLMWAVQILLICTVLIWPGTVIGQEKYIPSASDFGGVGLLQTRTARFGPDGMFDVGYSFIFPYERYLITLQALPWVEATFRYTSVTNRNFSTNAITQQFGASFKDRGADLKFRLRRESRYLPALAVGLQDTLGTGVFAGEYVVASKRYYDFDFSLGMGWGYSAGDGEIENPLTSLSDTFRSRSGGNIQGGTVPYTAWFGGETVGLFGGVEYTTPLRGMTLKLEYDPNEYSNEPLGNSLAWQSSWNIGLNYRPFQWVDLSFALERGRQFMWRVSMRSDLNLPGISKLDPPPPPLRPRPPAPEGDRMGVVAAPDGVAASLKESADPLGQHRVGPTRDFSTNQILPAATNELPRYIPTALDVPTRTSNLSIMPEARARTSLRNPYQEDAILEFLFEDLDANGIVVDSFSTSGTTATVQTATLPKESARIAAANAIFNALPMLLNSVTFVTPETLSTLTRPDVRRVQSIDELFDRLEEREIYVVSVEILGRRAVFHFHGGGSDWRKETQDAARIVADHLPLLIESVSFMRLSDETQVTRDVPVGPIPALNTTRQDSVSGDEGSHATIVWPPATNVKPGTDEVLLPTMVWPPDTSAKPGTVAKLFEELGEENFLTEGLELTPHRATIYVQQIQFREQARNIGRAARVVANNVPASVEEIVIVSMNSGVELNRVLILRKDLENAVARNGSPEEIWARAIIEEPLRTFLPFDTIKNPKRYPSVSLSLNPTVRQHIGSFEDFYLYGVYATLIGQLEVFRGLSVTAVANRVLYDQFDRIITESDSTLQKVRSDIKEYLQQGETSLVRFQADYLFMPVQNLYGRLSAGIFEEMYGGYGGEFLYRPFESRLAVGFEANWVRQRAFDQRSTFLTYTVVTGHFNAYYDMPWYNLLGQIHIGQYLARDRGVTLQMSRRFDSGVRMGAYATFTNISFEQFGEGSFDKGFFITVPFDLFSSKSSQEHGAFGFAPLTKDGGQRLYIGPRLYDVVGGGNLSGVARDWNRFLD
jgi:hypothetical protein